MVGMRLTWTMSAAPAPSGEAVLSESNFMGLTIPVRPLLKTQNRIFSAVETLNADDVCWLQKRAVGTRNKLKKISRALKLLLAWLIRKKKKLNWAWSWSGIQGPRSDRTGT